MAEISPIIIHPFFQFLGRFHPLIVHLPIGFLIIAYIMEMVGHFDSGKNRHFRQAVPFILVAGFICGVLAAITGFLLSRGGGYELEAVSSHQWSGISTALLTLITFILRQKKTYLPLFTITVISVFVSGHLGGELTHGKGFITQGLVEKGNKSEEKIYMAEMAVYPDVISPILEANCQSCHNEAKANNQLNLQNYDAILKGGISGLVVEAGNASTSAIIRRVSLPEDDDDAMPPEGKKRLDPDEIELLKIWINSGLPKDIMVADFDPAKGMIEIIRKINVRKLANAKPVFVDVPEASPKRIEQLIQAGFSALPIAKDYPQLQVSYFNRQDILSQKKVNLLKSVANQVVWLDISGANITDWRFLSVLKNLVRLHLKNTSVSDDDLQYLRTDNLEHLNLFNTNVTQRSLEKISSLKKLKTLSIGETGITTENLIALKNARPNLSVNIGDKKEFLLKGAELPMPSFNLNMIFIDQPTPLELNSSIVGVDYYYSFDASELKENWKKLDGNTITIDRSTEVNVFSKKDGWQISRVLWHHVFYQTHKLKDVKLSPDPSEKYAGEGAASVNDNNLGSIRFDDGTWLGYEGESAEITLELNDEIAANKISLNILVDNDYWIFPPKKVGLLASNDGQNYKRIAKELQPEPQPTDENSMKTIDIDLSGETARFLKLEIANRGLCPDWHPGKGKKAWFFFNEVIVE